MNDSSQPDPTETISVLADSMLQEAEDSSSRVFLEIRERFQVKLRNYVDKHLSPKLQTHADSSDILQSAFISFWKKLNSESQPAVDDHDDLWPYLIKITRRKLAKSWRRIYAQKRGAGKVLSAADLAAMESDSDFQNLVFDEFDYQLDLDLESILQKFDLETQTIASMKLSGMTNKEISQELSCSLRKVERKGSILRKAIGEYFDEHESLQSESETLS
ncbi:ECF-type sigma factor [Gimesia aquarii]|uniref:RNA polymerase sigma factor n=1 Tax=Gimesia aquarii TaxID=2527964 RepID=A0A517WQG6_9PLAN|nr:ECF-type sigma factor [Gimesia aquarii]QDU07494.1 RNA polymerase sigma factor [Gimesia aquarii]